MFRFWFSNEKLTDQGLKLAWFGVLVTCIGLIVTDLKWLSWFGLGGTIVGLIVRHRAEHLKKLHSAPRIITSTQSDKILQSLQAVAKQPMTVGFFGQDLEARQYAVQIKNLLESAGFTIVRLEGFLVFSVSHGLELVSFNSVSDNPTAVGVRDAFQSAGILIRMETNSNKMNPAISLNVHGKPPPTEFPSAREPGKS
jgi:hypothetical protein